MTDYPIEPSVGRPSLYRAEYADQVKKLCLLGLTDKEIAEFFEVCEATINNWKKQYPAFLESIHAGKTVADAEVAASMYRRATGETIVAERVVKLQDGTYDRMTISEYIPADVTAGRLWLMNRRGQNWRDKQVIEGPDGGPVQVIIQRFADPAS